MKVFARQRSFTRGGSLWVSGAVAVVLGVALFVINSRQHSEDEEQSPDLNNPGEPTDREREGNAPDDEPGCEHSAQQGQTDETDDGIDQAREDDDYVVLSEDEIGPAILRAASTHEFSVSSAEVRRTWSLIKGDSTKNLSARVRSILRTKDSEAAAAIHELISLGNDNEKGGEGGFGAMIREIVEQSANPACLKAKLRSLGEEHLTVEVKESHIQSLSEALVQAVGEALRARESLLPHTVAAWDDFLATAWACMMLAGAGECIRRKKRQDSSPRACIPVEVGGERSVVRGWRREGGLLKYSIPRAVRPNPTGVEKQRIARESAAASIAGIVGVGGKQ